MKKFCTLLLALILSFPANAELPYARAGMSSQEAAAHLLGRFSFGPQPGQVEAVAQQGLEKWFEEQLRAAAPDLELEERLSYLNSIDLSQQQLAEKYLPPGVVRREAKREGVELPMREDKAAYRRALETYRKKKGYKPLRELVGELHAQKLWRACHSDNQLKEVMTDFWFNHLYVSIADNQARPLVGHYEQWAIRPRALGSFPNLLSASAKHPAMLLYLDNANSSAAPDSLTSVDMEVASTNPMDAMGGRRFKQRMKKRQKGVNENYARELLELHTLGVNGGYTQTDVEELARILTGWAVLPPGNLRRRQLLKTRGKDLGFQVEDGFVFAAPLHDAESKTLLGTKFPAGQGLEEGKRALRLLADHPSTARHLSRKLAIRFVSDDPPEALVERLAQSFRKHRGQVKPWLRTLVHSPEFWESRGQKVKSPFELVVSAQRALACEMKPNRQLFRALEEMGQPLYRFQAPTGFPDQASHWISSATLLARMNFGLRLAEGRLPGTRLEAPELLGLRGQREKVLTELSHRLMPARDPGKTVQLLLSTSAKDEPKRASSRKNTARLLGLLLGSPEFQKR